jgi:hypothetical protein
MTCRRPAPFLNLIIRIGGTTVFEVEVSEKAFVAMYVAGDDLIACHVALDPAGFQWIARNANLAGDCADTATFAWAGLLRQDGVCRSRGGAGCAVARRHAG